MSETMSIRRDRGGNVLLTQINEENQSMTEGAYLRPLSCHVISTNSMACYHLRVVKLREYFSHFEGKCPSVLPRNQGVAA